MLRITQMWSELFETILGEKGSILMTSKIKEGGITRGGTGGSSGLREGVHEGVPEEGSYTIRREEYNAMMEGGGSDSGRGRERERVRYSMEGGRGVQE